MYNYNYMLKEEYISVYKETFLSKFKKDLMQHDSFIVIEIIKYCERYLKILKTRSIHYSIIGKSLHILKIRYI